MKSLRNQRRIQAGVVGLIGPGLGGGGGGARRLLSPSADSLRLAVWAWLRVGWARAEGRRGGGGGGRALFRLDGT